VGPVPLPLAGGEALSPPGGAGPVEAILAPGGALSRALPGYEPRPDQLAMARAVEEAHRAYLARFSDLEGLTQAGRRYRETLAERPGDPVALRFRDEVVARAAVQGIAQLPRTQPPRQLGRGARRALLAAMLLGAALAVSWVLYRFLSLGTSP
jgi:hypothetical protein